MTLIWCIRDNHGKYYPETASRTQVEATWKLCYPNGSLSSYPGWEAVQVEVSECLDNKAEGSKYTSFKVA